MYSSLVAMMSAFAVVSLVACSSPSGDGTTDSSSTPTEETNDELRTAGQRCGADYGDCKSGYVCDSDDPEVAGKCVRPGPGDEGGSCGGADHVRCKNGLSCEYDAPTHPNGHVILGMPIHPTRSGKCVRDD
jgi:hypothetical protein